MRKLLKMLEQRGISEDEAPYIANQDRISTASMNVNNFYSGSVRYQLSFLDKDHTIITNLNKDAELFDGIGNKEIILIPDNLTQNIKSNLEFYLNKAGLITSSPITKSPINTSNPGPQAPSNPNQAS